VPASIPKESEMRVRVLEREQLLARPLAEVFPFFADARNLQRLTPPLLDFQILTPVPTEMRPGALIDYRLRVHGVPLRWRTEITAWEPPHRFEDTQRRGPYRLWVHEHTFEEREGRTLAKDRVRYAIAGGELVHRLLVAPDLKRIFDYRAARLAELFGVAPGP
jgi:ligand-binding SRPBCC domain-containing protein